MWTREGFAKEGATLVGVPWFQNYRVLAAGLMVASAVLVWAFR